MSDHIGDRFADTFLDTAASRSSKLAHTKAAGLFCIHPEFHKLAQVLLGGLCDTRVTHSTYRPSPQSSFVEHRFLNGAREMAFRLAHAKYDPHSRRAYVELRADDEDGGEIVVVTIFSYRSKETLTKRRIEQEIVRKARHVLRKAGVAADGS